LDKPLAVSQETCVKPHFIELTGFSITQRHFDGKSVKTRNSQQTRKGDGDGH